MIQKHEEQQGGKARKKSFNKEKSERKPGKDKSLIDYFIMKR